MATSGYFAINTYGGEFTAGRAEYDAGLLGQVIVLFRMLVPDGLGSDTYSWATPIIIRTDRVNKTLDVVVDDGDNPMFVDAAFTIEDDDLVNAFDEAQGGGDLERIVELLIRQTAGLIQVGPLTPAVLDLVEEWVGSEARAEAMENQWVPHQHCVTRHGPERWRRRTWSGRTADGEWRVAARE